jgi:subtilisin family serine protease
MAKRSRRPSRPSRASASTVQKVDRELTLARTETVSFEVVCRPKSGASLPQLMGELSMDTLKDSTPEDRTLFDVSKRLQEQGFTVFVDDASSSVSAEGPAGLFEKTFQTRLRKRGRTLKAATREHSFEFIDTVKDAPEPSTVNVPGSLFVSIQRPPIFFASPLPPPIRYFHLRVPGDVAMLTHASATHRRTLPLGTAGATGHGVKVAMLDTGFNVQPYFARHGYRLNPIAAADAPPPANVDSNGHGTGEVANIFACAPDAQVFGVKMGGNPVLSFDKAMSIAPRVISCSWGFHLPGVTTLPPALVPLRLRIMSVVASGVTVVFSAGNGHVGFPGMMPEVISVGGVFADQNVNLRASNYASSFTSLIFPGRRVPDFCGLVGMQPKATYIMLPIPPSCAIDVDLGGVPQPNKDETATNDGWGVFSGTSAAAPQVAGICALLLQKRPTLTPAQVKAILRGTATDVTVGVSAMGQPAGPGVDAATGSGLVHALNAWLSA